MKEVLITFFKNIGNLFKIKSVLTLVIMFTISYLVIKGTEVPSEYAAFAGSIITYFFTKADTKKMD